MTPKMAREWLLTTEDTAGQRSIAAGRVALFAAAMERGEWQVTHQAVAVDVDGRVVDGRHRLSAVVLHKKPVRMLVAYDAAPESFAVIDTGRARTAADALRIAGHTNVTVIAAAARILLAYPRLAGTKRTPQQDITRVTNSEVLALVEGQPYGELLPHASTVGERLRHQLGRLGMRAFTTAAAAYLTYEAVQYPRTVEEFYGRLADGVMLDALSPIYSLRRWLMSDTGYPMVDQSVRSWVAMAHTITAFNDYAAGRERQSVRFVVGQSRWPTVVLPTGFADVVPDVSGAA